MRPAVTIGITMLLLALAACSRPGPRSTPLFGELESYQSPGDIRHKLNAGERWQVINERVPLPTDTRPRFHTLHVRVREINHLGVPGELELYFFNDRLMRTFFYPVDLASYRAALGAGANIAFPREGSMRRDPATKIWVGKTAEGRSYVGWEDLNLLAEHNAWIAEYS